MTTATWFLLVGLLLLLMGLTYPFLKRQPITSSIIYLLVGIAIGPMGFGLFHFNPLKQSGTLEILTEIAVLISLFSAGVKMPVPMTLARWQAPLRLAFLSMAMTVGLVTLFGYYLLGIPLGAAVLLGAIVAPTDPVLATDVQMRRPGDNDHLRFSLSCEAGMNDGSAFPFVMLGLGLLGLHDLGDFGLRWVLVDLLWATAAGIGIGAFAGIGLAHLVTWIRHKRQGVHLLDDFLGLGLIGAVYGLSVWCQAWGFLAVFAAAVALRQTELKIVGAADELPLGLQSDVLGGLKPTDPRPGKKQVHQVSEASLVFKEHLERLSEMVLVLLVGGTLFFDSWSWRAIGFALFLFMIARPVSVFTSLLGTRMPVKERQMIAWFGVRGIGSLYYLMYAIQHGLSEAVSLQLIQLTLVVVTLSILLHGASVKPLILRYSKRHR